MFICQYDGGWHNSSQQQQNNNNSDNIVPGAGLSVSHFYICMIMVHMVVVSGNKTTETRSMQWLSDNHFYLAYF